MTNKAFSNLGLWESPQGHAAEPEPVTLKPCPFCGGLGEINIYPETHDSEEGPGSPAIAIAGCSACEIWLPNQEMVQTAEEAVKVWNTRIIHVETAESIHDPANPKNVCRWTHGPFAGLWESDCGREINANCEVVGSGNYIHCPGCGRPIEAGGEG